MTSDRRLPRPTDDSNDDLDYCRAAPATSSSIADELLAKHGRSPQPSSARLVALLKAMLDVLDSRKLAHTPAALFAACMSGLQRELESGSENDEARKKERERERKE